MNATPRIFSTSPLSIGNPELLVRLEFSAPVACLMHICVCMSSQCEERRFMLNLQRDSSNRYQLTQD